MAKNVFSFSVNVQGDVTGERFSGNFEAKKFLSINDRLTKDSIRRSLLGERPQDATPDSHVRAEMLSHLSVSIVESPKAWKESRGGLDLCDDNIVMDVFDEVVKGQEEATKALSKEGEDAKEKLRKAAKKPVKEDSQKDEGTGGGAA